MKISEDGKLAAFIIIGVGVVAGVALFSAGVAFEYVLWSLTTKDAPFLLDIVGGTAISPALIPLVILCAVCRTAGYSPPILH